MSIKHHERTCKVRAVVFNKPLCRISSKEWKTSIHIIRILSYILYTVGIKKSLHTVVVV